MREPKRSSKIMHTSESDSSRCNDIDFDEDDIDDANESNNPDSDKEQE